MSDNQPNVAGQVGRTEEPNERATASQDENGRKA